MSGFGVGGVSERSGCDYSAERRRGCTQDNGGPAGSNWLLKNACWRMFKKLLSLLAKSSTEDILNSCNGSQKHRDEMGYSIKRLKQSIHGAMAGMDVVSGICWA